MKTFIYVLSCLLILAFANGAFAWVEWRYAGTNHNWNQPNNWTPAQIPAAGQYPIMRGYGSDDYAVIGSGVNAVGHTMWVGFSGQADLNVAGGSLTLNALHVGVDGGPGNVNLSSGIITINGDPAIGDGSGTGNLNITGGSFIVNGGWLYLGYNGGTGTINLDGGTLTTFKVFMSSGNPHMNITNGKLIITNTDSVGVINEFNGYIQAGQVTLFGGNPLAEYSAVVNGSGYTEITASIRSADVWNPTPANNSTGISRNPTISWFAGTTSERTLPILIDFKNDPCLAQFSGTAIYRTEFNVTDMQHTLLSLGTVYGIAEVTLNGINLGHKWYGEYTYDAASAMIIGTNVLEVKVTTTLSNFFSVWDNPVAQMWTRNREPISEGMVGPVRLLRQE
ncbi:MAG: glycosylhydrolase-like jelly roll fold domain-containing protein [Phycisphaerae bacterium]